MRAKHLWWDTGKEGRDWLWFGLRLLLQMFMCGNLILSVARVGGETCKSWHLVSLRTEGTWPWKELWGTPVLWLPLGHVMPSFCACCHHGSPPWQVPQEGYHQSWVKAGSLPLIPFIYKVDSLKYFVKTMKKRGRGALLIWYTANSVEGGKIKGRPYRERMNQRWQIQKRESAS